MNNKLLHNKNLLIIFSITMISLMGVASLTPAFPGISKAFKILPKQVGLLITIFTLPGIFLTPVLGVLADRFGRKKIIVPALMIFGVAGFLCFFTRDFNTLVFLRFFQGVGAASLGSLNGTLISDMFQANDRVSAMGYNASVISISTAIYPIIGGILASLGWFYPFLLPIIGVVVGFIVLFGLKNPEPSKTTAFNEYLKNILKSIKEKQLISLFLISLLTFVILYGPYLSYLPFIIEDTFKQRPYIIGLIMMFSSISSFTSSSQMGRLSERLTGKQMIIISTFFYMLSMLLIPFATNVWFLILPSILFGLAQGINLPSIMTLIASLAPINQRAAIMSVNGMVFSLGQTLGPLLIIPVYGIWGISGAFTLGSVAAFMMLCIAFFMLKKDIS